MIDTHKLILPWHIKSAGLNHILYFYMVYMGQDSTVSIATHYGLDGPGIESWWGQDFPHPSRPTLVSTQPPTQWILELSQGVKGWGMALITHPHLATRLQKEYSYTSTPPLDRGLF